MRGRLLQLGFTLLLAGVVIGCKTTPPPPPNKEKGDPLFYTKKPIEGRPHDASAEEMVRVDPQPPPLPRQSGSAAVAQQPVSLGTPIPNP